MKTKQELKKRLEELKQLKKDSYAIIDGRKTSTSLSWMYGKLINEYKMIIGD